MLKSCSYCGKIHPYGTVCPNKPKQKKKRGRKKTDGFEAEYIRFTSSSSWQKTRDKIKQRDLYLCRVCMEEGRADGCREYDAQLLEVHHIIPVKEDWDKRFHEDNLITLCRVHHEAAESGRISRDRLQGYIKNSPPGGKI